MRGPIAIKSFEFEGNEPACQQDVLVALDESSQRARERGGIQAVANRGVLYLRDWLLIVRCSIGPSATS